MSFNIHFNLYRSADNALQLPGTSDAYQKDGRLARKVNKIATNIEIALSEKEKKSFDTYLRMLESFEQHVLNNHLISLHRNTMGATL